MQQTLNYYTLLGVAPGASRKEIKAAYHRLARQYHPDVNPGNPAAEEYLKQVNVAYEILSDPHKRARYDREEFASQANEQRWRRDEGWTRRQREPAGRNTRYTSYRSSASSRYRYTVEEMNQFVFNRLQRQVNHDRIIGELSEWAGLDWLQAAGFVRYAEIIHRCEIARRKRLFAQLVWYASTSLAGMALNFLMAVAVAEFYLPYGGLLGIVISISYALFIGGLVGFIRTLNTM